MNINRLFLKFRSRQSLCLHNRRSYSAENSPNVGEPGLEQARDLRNHSYPSFIPSIMVSQFLVDYQHVENNATLQDVPVSVSGRVQQKRVHSTLFFLFIKQDKESVQIKVHSKHTQNYAAAFQDIRKGDIISVTGFPHRTPSGELSVLADQVQLLAPACHDLPPWNGLKDSSVRYRQRYLDMLVNRDANAVLRKRAEIISALRNYLDVRGFVEVETPVLSPSAGGAIANPFVTHSKSLKATLSLRIAPELFLKQLVVGGLDRVYEIGRVFRNEGIDKSHNPEFTSCEFYQAYTDYYQLMDMTEDLLRTIVFHTTGKYQVTAINPEDKETEITIDFSQPFKRISVIEAIEEKIGEKLKINESPEVFAAQLDSIFGRLELQMPSNGPVESTPSNPASPTKNPSPAKASPSQLIDELISHFVEPLTTQPTFLIDHPILLSPLARKHRKKPGMTERFELFVNRMELCNAYTELNDPFEQKERFDMQETENHQLGVFKSEETKDAESEYVRALEYGLPPTGGWGMGIDRLVMLLTGHAHIRDVLAFPMLRSKKFEE